MSSSIEFESADEFREALKAELGYCTCAAHDALPLLRDILRLSRDRLDNSDDHDAFVQISHEISNRLMLTTAPGLASWFVYALHRAKLVKHAFNVPDLFITNKGRRFLDALEKYPNLRLSDDDNGHTVDEAEAK